MAPDHELKLCKDCQHLRRGFFGKPSGAGRLGPYYWDCMAPQLGRNLQAGYQRSVACGRLREDPLSCGPHGKWFVQYQYTKRGFCG